MDGDENKNPQPQQANENLAQQVDQNPSESSEVVSPVQSSVEIGGSATTTTTSQDDSPGGSGSSNQKTQSSVNRDAYRYYMTLPPPECLNPLMAGLLLNQNSYRFPIYEFQTWTTTTTTNAPEFPVYVYGTIGIFYWEELKKVPEKAIYSLFECIFKAVRSIFCSKLPSAIPLSEVFGQPKPHFLLNILTDQELSIENFLDKMKIGTEKRSTASVKAVIEKWPHLQPMEKLYNLGIVMDEIFEFTESRTMKTISSLFAIAVLGLFDCLHDQKTIKQLKDSIPGLNLDIEVAKPHFSLLSSLPTSLKSILVQDVILAGILGDSAINDMLKMIFQQLKWSGLSGVKSILKALRATHEKMNWKLVKQAIPLEWLAFRAAVEAFEKEPCPFLNRELMEKNCTRKYRQLFLFSALILKEIDSKDSTFKHAAIKNGKLGVRLEVILNKFKSSLIFIGDNTKIEPDEEISSLIKSKLLEDA